jgi:hypothetical protein
MNQLNPLQYVIIALVVHSLGWGIYGIFFNRPLYCKIALMGGGIGNLPAFCLLDKINQLQAKQ